MTKASLMFTMSACILLLSSCSIDITSTPPTTPQTQKQEFATLDTVRILIFPHVDTYTAPHGFDNVTDKITLVATARCEVSTSTQKQIINPVNGKTELTFKYQSNFIPRFVSCDSPVIVQREAGLKSHSYDGGFFVKVGLAVGRRPAIFVINHIHIESYLRGVIPSEMPANWPFDALKAQAVTARTYAYHQILRARENPVDPDYDIDDTIFYQAYQGKSSYHPRTDRAVDDTYNEVLVYDNFPIIAYFNADSGGVTEAAANVFSGRAPYCVSKKEVYDQELVNTDWTISHSLPELESRLKKGNILLANQVLSMVEVRDKERFPSGRLENVYLHLSDGTITSVLATEFRLHASLRSTLFSMKTKTTRQGPPLFVFKGKGYGHGVGMSQWGAKTLAESLSWDYKKILHFYYSNVQLTHPPQRANHNLLTLRNILHHDTL